MAARSCGEVEVNGEMKEATVRSVYEAIGARMAGRSTDEELKLIEDHACPTHGACGGQYTANTMAMAMERGGRRGRGRTW